MYKGIEASRGIGIGSICLITDYDLSFEAKHIEDTEAEKSRLGAAVETLKVKTSAMADNIRKTIGPKEAEIMEGHIAMIADPAMSGEMNKMIDAGQCAEAAVPGRFLRQGTAKRRLPVSRGTFHAVWYFFVRGYHYFTHAGRTLSTSGRAAGFPGGGETALLSADFMV